jgi:hypothetical protein
MPNWCRSFTVVLFVDKNRKKHLISCKKMDVSCLKKFPVYFKVKMKSFWIIKKLIQCIFEEKLAMG